VGVGLGRLWKSNCWTVQKKRDEMLVIGLKLRKRCDEDDENPISVLSIEIVGEFLASAVMICNGTCDVRQKVMYAVTSWEQ